MNGDVNVGHVLLVFDLYVVYYGWKEDGVRPVSLHWQPKTTTDNKSRKERSRI